MTTKGEAIAIGIAQMSTVEYVFPPFHLRIHANYIKQDVHL